MKFSIVSSTFLVITLLGCSVFSGMARQIDVVLKNQTPSDIKEAEIYFGEYFVFGEHHLVGKGHGSTYLDYPHVNGTKAEVHWKIGEKEPVKEVDFGKILPKGKSGKLVFTIKGEAVEVEFEPSKSK